MKPSDSWKPFFQRFSSIFYLAGILGVVLLVMLYSDCKQELATEIVDAQVVSQRYEAEYRVHKWTAVRKYNRSSLPACAWDTKKETFWVCDEWEEICVEKDSLNNCVKTEKGKCIRGHLEEEWDYNIHEWKHFQDFEAHGEQKHVPAPIILLRGDPKHYKVRLIREDFYVTVRSEWSEREFRHMPVTGTHVRVERRKKSKKLLKIL